MQTVSDSKIIQPNRVYTPKELCDLFQISYRTYNRWRKEESIPKALIWNTTHKKQHHRYLGSDILEWLKGKYE